MANALGTLFSDIANAIRGKTGDTGTMKPAEFPAAITGISVGSGGATSSGGSVTLNGKKLYVMKFSYAAYYADQQVRARYTHYKKTHPIFAMVWAQNMIVLDDKLAPPASGTHCFNFAYAFDTDILNNDAANNAYASYTMLAYGGLQGWNTGYHSKTVGLLDPIDTTVTDSMEMKAAQSKITVGTDEQGHKYIEFGKSGDGTFLMDMIYVGLLFFLEDE